MWVGTFHGLCNRMLRAHHRDARPAAAVPDPRHAGPARADQADVPTHTTSTTTAIRRGSCNSSSPDAKEEGLRPNHGRGGRRLHAPAWSSTTRSTRRCASAKAWSISRSSCCAATSSSPDNDALREHYQRRFSHLLVDEFQDTNALPVPVAAHACRDRTRRVFAVGDDDQSIYAFRGANVANMQQFERDFATPEQPVKLIKLEQNYRSHGHILDAANALIRNNQARLGKNLWTSEGKGEPVRAFAAPTDHRRGGVRRRRREGLAADGVALDEVALLYRSNAQSRVLEHALFSAALPYRVYGGMRFFERAEVKHALAYLRLIAAPGTTARSCASSTFRRAGSARARSSQLQDAAREARRRRLWQAARAAARSAARPARALAHVRRADRIAAHRETRALPLPEAVEHVIEQLGPHRSLPGGKGRAGSASRTSTELVTAADGFVREAELATDAPMLSDRVAIEAQSPRAARDEAPPIR